MQKDIVKCCGHQGTIALALLLLFFPYSTDAFSWVLNNPYPETEQNQLIFYSSFSEQPKTLDPAKSYSSNEYIFIGQILEPVLEYDYLKRPYQLKPLTATEMPQIRYLDKNAQEISGHESEDIAYTVYRLKIKPGLYYQPHPAFAKDASGQYFYHHLSEDYLEDNDISQLSDFKQTGSREVLAQDYVYEIKRLAHPAVSSPIYGIMSEYILGFKAFGRTLPKASAHGRFIDLNQYPLEGVKLIDPYSFEITLKGQYAQFIFWLAMPFFAPVPWEADLFYSQPGMDEKNISFDWYPVGTGPFMLTNNNPNRRIVLEKNPNFREDYFPAQGSDEDRKAGYLKNAGQRLPLIHKAVYTLEKESIPRWSKFIQGYYDSSGISTDSFDQAIQINRFGEAIVSPAMKAKNIRLTQMVDPSLYYLGFNMLDQVVGGKSKRARKLRQAISIAVNYDENIAIFMNGRGSPAQGPIPPGIFGYKDGDLGINPLVYRWSNGIARRRGIEDAKKLLKEAGYPHGRDPKTGRSLILNYDVPATGGPDDKAQLNWMRKQFNKLGISLNIRATEYNRFQEKMRNGNAQIFSWGWNADYPDPENFLFLLYGPNAKVQHGGENAANYINPRYDQLFDQMKNRPNDAKRQAIIDQMVDIVRHDAPWAGGINTKSFLLSQQWVSKIKPNTIAQNTLKYVGIDVPLRNKMRALWNQPILWPLGLTFLLLLALLLPLFFAWRKKEKNSVKRVTL